MKIFFEVKEKINRLKKTKTYSFINIMIKQIREDEVSMLAGQVTYRFILAFFPFLIFIISIVGFTPLTIESVIDDIAKIVPNEAYTVIEGILENVLNQRSSAVLSASMLGTVWISSSALVALMRGINKAYGIKDRRKFLKKRGLALLATLWLGLGIVFSMVLIVFGKVIGEYVFELLGVGNIFNMIWGIFRYILFILTVVFLTATLYYVFPNKKMEKRKILPGAIFSTIGWVIISLGFSFYINNFSNYSNTYGSIAGIIILILWLYWISTIILLGAELNVALGQIKKS